MITLESLGCDKAPRLTGLNARFATGDVPSVCGADDGERSALVELLAGYRTETEGRLLLDRRALSPRARRSEVVVLPQKPALTSDLTIGEHLRLVARLRGRDPDVVTLDQLLGAEWRKLSKRRPADLEPEVRLRVTLALSLLGRPALVIALDPLPEVGALLGELAAPDRTLLVVAASLQGIERQVTRVLGLENGTLQEGMGAVVPDPASQLYGVRVAQGGAALEALLSTYAGVDVERLSNGTYRLTIQRAVALAPLVRALLAVGVAFEELTPLAEHHRA